MRTTLEIRDDLMRSLLARHRAELAFELRRAGLALPPTDIEIAVACARASAGLATTTSTGFIPTFRRCSSTTARRP